MSVGRMAVQTRARAKRRNARVHAGARIMGVWSPVGSRGGVCCATTNVLGLSGCVRGRKRGGGGRKQPLRCQWKSSSAHSRTAVVVRIRSATIDATHTARAVTTPS